MMAFESEIFWEHAAFFWWSENARRSLYRFIRIAALSEAAVDDYIDAVLGGH